MKISDYGSRKDFVVILPFVALIFGAVIHEYAHVVVALNLGLQVDDVIFTFAGPCKVIVDWTSADVGIGGLFMLGFIGGLMEGLFYAIIVLKVREMSLMALGLLVYGITEAFKIGTWSPDFFAFDLAVWFNGFIMMFTVILIGRRRHYEWTQSKNEKFRRGIKNGI